MDQPSLFKGWRERKVASPTEFQIQATLVDMLRRWINPRWQFTHLPFGEYRTQATAGRLKRMGVNAGWPDFIFIGPDRALLFLELKRAGGVQSDAQGNVALHILRSGFDYQCVDSLDAALAELRDRGILRVHI